MPNWNYNSVEIHAPLEAVKTWLVPTRNDSYEFNMHKLFPDAVPQTDPTGEQTWNYDWYVDNTGSKWAPEVHLCTGVEPDITYLSYDTARAPNNKTIVRLHELTGWHIVNEYEEPGMSFEGTLTCDEHGITDEERPYRTSCEICEEKKDEDDFDEEQDGLICNDCRSKSRILIS